MKKSNKYKPSMFKYIAIALVIFVVAVIISVATRMILVSDPRFSGFSDDQASLVTSMIEGAVGAIAAGFVLYQLKGEELAENLENEIHAADFYHHFIDYWLETDRMFIEHPECRKYFYDDADVTKLDSTSTEYQLVMGFAEYFDDLFRYSKTEIQKQNEGFAAIPQDQIDSYMKYMESVREKPVFQHYRTTYGAWVNSNERGG